MKRVLVLDDDRDATFVLKSMLERSGVEVSVDVTDGVLAALAAVVRARYDLVLVDYVLNLDWPLTGMNVARWAHEVDPLATIVLVTAHTRDALADLGGTWPQWLGHLTKPVTKKMADALLAEEPT